MATLFVDKIDPQSGTALEIGTSGDTITVPAGATINLSAATQTGVGETNSPYFNSTQNSGQSIANETTTKITYDVSGINVGGGTYDTAESRWTHGVAGRYLISAWVFIKYAVSSGQRIDMEIYKNGSRIKAGRWRAGGDLDGSSSAFVQGIVTLDADDYVEAFCWQNSSASRSIDNNSAFTFFEGFKIANT